VQIHEKPNLLKGSKDILKENMVFTVEPGIYDDYGIRIEDDVLVTRRGAIILTKTTKRLAGF
jgi:Xaa-Pro aminopeptidase